MPSAALGTVFDPDRLARRVVRIAMGITLVVAAILYAGKAAEDRSAFVRWRPQVLQLMRGVNIYNTTWFPNPPIMPISLYPLMVLPPVVGAMAWFLIKAALAIVAGVLCIRMVRPGAGRVSPWIDGAIVLLSMRPILSDLHHGNNNILILFLVVATVEAWRRGYDVLAGLILGFAITYKVTPALFVPYFLYKRSWRTVGATFLGMAIFFGLIPSLVLGPQFNLECLQAWWNRVIGPYIEGGEVGRLEINQSMVGVLMRLLTEAKAGDRYDSVLGVNFVSWNPRVVIAALKGLSLAMVGVLALVCRTKARRRDDPRLFGEFALVVLTMLFISERSWKHHYVTLLLPFTYLAYRAGSPTIPRRTRTILAAVLGTAALLMATTSSEIGGILTDGGHKIAQGYGMFFWAGLVLYIATAWRVVVEGRFDPGPGVPAQPAGLPAPAHHLGASSPKGESARL